MRSSSQEKKKKCSSPSKTPRVTGQNLAASPMSENIKDHLNLEEFLTRA